MARSIRATWTRIAKHADLQRSSHVLSVAGNKAYIFGGELVPRQPRDNVVYNIDLNSTGEDAKIATHAANVSGPSPRVGSACTTLNGRIYLFSGRGGVDMAPVDEKGALWEFDPAASSWKSISPAGEAAPVPPARSYHCMASDGVRSVFVHAGCPTSGRLSDLWKYDVAERKWTELSAAPDPPRGGTSIAFAAGKLWRMNGFDGKTEQGGAIDVFEPASDSWSTRRFEADGQAGPEARSVSALLPVTAGGRNMLLTIFGERDPSSLGHAGAGKMLGDFWLYDIEDNKWFQGEAKGEAPAARGWFDADAVSESQIVVAGGLNEENERLDDVWVLSF